MFPLYYFRKALTTDENLDKAEATALCKGLQAESTLPMPKTAAQFEVLKSFMVAGDKDHLDIVMDAQENTTWLDGGEVDRTVVDPEDYVGCTDETTIQWVHSRNIFYCDTMPGSRDGNQLCQLILPGC